MFRVITGVFSALARRQDKGHDVPGRRVGMWVLSTSLSFVTAQFELATPWHSVHTQVANLIKTAICLDTGLMFIKVHIFLSVCRNDPLNTS